ERLHARDATFGLGLSAQRRRRSRANDRRADADLPNGFGAACPGSLRASVAPRRLVAAGGDPPYYGVVHGFFCSGHRLRADPRVRPFAHDVADPRRLHGLPWGLEWLAGSAGLRRLGPGRPDSALCRGIVQPALLLRLGPPKG